MSEILSSTAFTDLRIDYADAARRATLYTTPEGYALKAHLGAQLDAAYAALRAEVERLEEKVRRIESACGLPDPAEACRVILAIAAEEWK